MFPLRDINPTRTTPVVTFPTYGSRVWVSISGIQATDSLEGQQEFLYQRAVISCEITTGSPLSLEENPK